MKGEEGRDNMYNVSTYMYVCERRYPKSGVFDIEHFHTSIAVRKLNTKKLDKYTYKIRGKN